MSPMPVSRQRASAWWWLAPTLFSFVGGIVAYLKLRHRDPTTANTLLTIGTFGFVLVIAAGLIGLAVFLVGDMVVFLMRNRLWERGMSM